MIVALDTDKALEKMRELCSELLEQEAYRAMREAIEQFAADERSAEQYESFMIKHRELERKEERNEEPTTAEMDEYEQAERELYANDVIRRYLYAQREFSHLHHQISQYFRLTVELNRLPEPSELKKGGCGCGGNCGCGAGH
jgi:cell fate (sporulation/competence/biofilm development) regulator YlbF (YheA/YmcA/DUF963 family)